MCREMELFPFLWQTWSSLISSPFERESLIHQLIISQSFQSKQFSFSLNSRSFQKRLICSECYSIPLRGAWEWGADTAAFLNLPQKPSSEESAIQSLEVWSSPRGSPSGPPCPMCLRPHARADGLRDVPHPRWASGEPSLGFFSPKTGTKQPSCSLQVKLWDERLRTWVLCPHYPAEVEAAWLRQHRQRMDVAEALWSLVQAVLEVLQLLFSSCCSVIYPYICLVNSPLWMQSSVSFWHLQLKK